MSDDPGARGDVQPSSDLDAHCRTSVVCTAHGLVIYGAFGMESSPHLYVIIHVTAISAESI